MMSELNIIAAVTGANSGLGKALCIRLPNWGIHVIPIYGPDKDGFDLREAYDVFAVSQLIRKETADWMEDFERVESYNVLINCAGTNYIEWFQNAKWEEMDKVMDLNLKAPMRLIQDLIGGVPGNEENWFNGSGAVLNIVSNASHMPMTNSAFYNASKGALHIATLALARELRKTHGLCVFGISPNKLSGTNMSKYIEGRVPELRGWTPEQAAAYQAAALPCGQETDPYELADFIGYLLSTPSRHFYLTNTIIPYGA